MKDIAVVAQNVHKREKYRQVNVVISPISLLHTV